MTIAGGPIGGGPIAANPRNIPAVAVGAFAAPDVRIGYLVEIDALDPASETRTTIRLAASDDDRITGLGDYSWWPGIIGLPTLAKEGWDGDFTGAAQIAAASFTVDPQALRKNDAQSPSWRWAGAPVRIYEGYTDQVWEAWTLRFTGLIEDYRVDESGQYSFDAAVDSEPFEAALLETTYAGTGGAEGGDDLKGKPKPFCYGYAKNVEPVLIDTVNNVFQVHGYGAIEDITNVYERAADFVENGGTDVGDFADYADLVAEDIPEGSFGTCLAEGMFRLGAPPAGLITADVKGDNGGSGGWVRQPSYVIQRLCDVAGVDSSRIDSTSMLAFASAVPRNINDYLTTSVRLFDYIQAIAQSCNAQALLSWTGKLQVCRFASIGTASLTLDAQGEELPPVLSVAEVKTSPPYWRIEMLGNRSHRVHSKEEVAFVLTASEIVAGAEAATNGLNDDGTVKDDKVGTGAVVANAITQKEFWQDSWPSGESGDALGDASGGTWSDFGDSGDKASISFTNDEGDGEVSIRWFVNHQRTGGDNDRVNWRLMRSIDGGAYSQVGDDVLGGAANFPAVTTYEWLDTALAAGSYIYKIQYNRVDGIGTYWGAKMIADIGNR